MYIHAPSGRKGVLMGEPDLEPTLPDGDLAPELAPPADSLERMRLSLRIGDGPWVELGTIEAVREGRGTWPA